eukprot:10644_3
MCLSVMPVNQRPSFSLRYDVLHRVEEDEGMVYTCDECVGLAYDITPGPLEQHQTVSFTVVPLNASISSVQQSVEASPKYWPVP